MKPIWILVADSSAARIFTTEHSASDLIEVEDFFHYEALQQEGDLVSDSPGRGHDSISGGNHAFTGEVSPKEQESIEFAKRIAKQLNDELNQNKFEKLFVIAAPNFLGKLRNAFSKGVAKHIVFSLGKNLVTQNSQEIRGHLPDSLV
ncbi:MAG: host attachment protein [Pseudomonadota bacterium]|nr:host attachment protein [Pseudomonadota bacterium]